MMRLVQFVSVVLFSTMSFGIHADELDIWLDKMMHAMKMNNYEGTLVLRQADTLQTLYVQHGMDERGMWESLESLNGEARQVIRQNGRVTTIFPGRELVIVSESSAVSSLHPSLPKNREVLKKLYRMKLGGEDRVARKQAQILELIPKDQYRYGFKYWLEKDTGLLLKCDLLDEQGKIVEQLMFSDLRLLDKSPGVQSLPEQMKQYRVVDMDAGNQQQTSSIWKVQKLPTGFMLTRSTTKPARHNKGIVHHLVYSDGIASVSVFVEKHQSDEQSLVGESSMGAVNVYSLHQNSDHITAIGEVPLDTVRMIAQSVERVE
ncbi:MAG: MucB/RseB C-terminal domain-containing protein [Gammaproteobacteria bacterium]|nr:MucB/RseB C-terminal domain-containing protein [Gammaproteobacteria bacterium]